MKADTVNVQALDELLESMRGAAVAGLCLPSVDLNTVDKERASKISQQLGMLIRTLERKGIKPATEAS